MSAKKTIKALREQRDAVAAEVRRLQQAIDTNAIATSPELEGLVSGIRRALGMPPRVVFAVEFPELPSPDMSEEALRAKMVELGIDVQHPLVEAALTGSTATWAKSLAALERNDSVPEPPHVQLILSRGHEQLVARVSIRPSVPLAEVYDAATDALYRLSTCNHSKISGDTQ